MPTAEQYMQGIAAAQAAGDAEAVEALKAEMTGTGGVMANIGAGMKNIGMGAAQLVGMGPGDEELAEERRIARSAHGGNIGLQAAQVAGEIVPTLAVPGGTGARMLTRTLGGAGRMGAGRAAAGAALEGAAVGAALPVMGDESRMANVALGGAGGAVAPLAVRGVMSAARAPAALLERGRAAIGQGGAAAERLGGREVADVLTREAGDIGRFAGPQDYVPLTGAPHEFAPTSAAAFGDERLAALEKASRTADAPAWATRDAEEAAKRWEHLSGGLRTEDDLARAKGAMNEIPPRYGDISQRKLGGEVEAFAQQLEQATRSAPYRTNAVVRSAVDEARRVIGGGQVTPEVMHGLRMTLAGGLKGAPGLTDEAIRAARSDPKLLGMVQSIDEMMERAGLAGKPGWARWREQYARAAREAEGAKAETRLRGAFVDERGVPVRGTSGEPQLTPHALRRAVAATRTMKRGPRAGEPLYSKAAQQAVDDVLKDLDRADIVNQVRKAATLGGSDTAYNLSRMGAAGVLFDLFTTGGLGAGVGGALVQTLGKKNIDAAKRRILTEILQDPEKLREFVQAAASRTQQEAARAGVPVLPYGAGAAGLAAPALEAQQ